MTRLKLLTLLTASLVTASWLQPAFAGAADSTESDGIAFFEQRIRPVLVERCYECHSSQAKELAGSLSLETRDAARKGGDQGPAVVPGDLEKSLLMRAIRYTDTDLQMPPKAEQRLPAQVVADFEAWIKGGALDPRDGSAVAASKYAVDIEAAKQRWPFTPVTAPNIPAVQDTEWPLNPIDHFLLAELEERGLAPAEDADPRTLIRRLTYDLTGLPPTPAEVEAFVAESVRNPQSAIRNLADRLLASLAYGERWGRHWLDVVRYADTAGDNSDYPVPQMYKYRNWVIQAMNDDMPYDEFVRQQIAGDLLPAATIAERHSKIIATGYLANARRFGSRVSDYPQHLTIEDTIDNLGRAFLGMSLACARCHNHKFDPFTNDDYYALYGIFHSTRFPWPGIELEKKQRDLVPLVPEEVVEKATAERKKQVELIAAEVKACEAAKKAGDELVKALAARLDALKAQQATAEDAKSAEKEAKEAKEQGLRLDALVKAAKRKKTELENSAWPFETAYAVAEAKKIEDCKIHLKGDPERTGPLVPRHLPVVFGGHPLQTPELSGRLELADWIVSPDNPLTSRVIVNRLWHHHFGRGLVPTPNDFGKQGKPPTHPELLDYLALRFMESGWSLKAMHRLIVTSRAYQMSSMITDEARMNKDPNNELLSRFNRRRLDAESIRDTLLILGGNLDPTMPHEPHPFPPQHEWDFTQHKPFKAVYETNRRSVYLMTQRIQRHPLMAIFDGPDTGASTGSRPTSTTTLQALYFLNDPFVHEQAERLAARLLADRSTDKDRIDLAYVLCFSRLPTNDEVEICNNALGRFRTGGHSDAFAWTSVCRSLIRANEFVYLN